LNGECPICGWKGKLTKHHKLKRVVFPELKNKEGNTIAICRYPCHDAVELVITAKENALLRKHKQEVYLDTLQDFLDGKIDPEEVIRNHKKHKGVMCHPSKIPKIYEK
jgi:hypothetical protein